MNELKTLIDLCPGIRLPRYEPEIFSDKELTEHYLRKLCEQYDWYYHGNSVPRMVYYYARKVMKCRWPEAEPVMSADLYYCRRYNRWFGTQCR